MNKKFDGYVIFSDLDGTLLNDNKEICSANADAIKYFIENGGRFSIATGRPIQAVLKYIENLKIDMPLITCNGGVIYDYNNKKIVKSHFLEDHKKALADKILRDFDDVEVEVFCGNDLYILRDTGMSQRPGALLLNVIHDIPENIYSLGWNRILLCAPKEILDQIEKNFEIKYNTKLIRSDETLFEIMPDGISKGKALSEIISTYNLNKSKVIACGDEMNDIELLSECGIACVPVNGSETVKKRADFITCDNNTGIITDVIKIIGNKIYK